MSNDGTVSSIVATRSKRARKAESTRKKGAKKAQKRHADTLRSAGFLGIMMRRRINRPRAVQYPVVFDMHKDLP